MAAIRRDWTSADDADPGRVGSTFAGTTLYMSLGSSPCAAERAIYCLGNDEESRVEPNAPGRLAFVTRDVVRGDAGRSGFDEVCQNEADRAGLDGTFLAAVHMSGSPASDRFSLSRETWVRPDGVEVFAEAADLEELEPIAPISVTADGDDHLDVLAWTGLRDNCDDWRSSDGQADVGRSALSADIAFREGFSGEDCSSTQRLYCFEY